MNYTKAMVAAGYGAAILPVEGPSAAMPLPGIRTASLSPALWRETWSRPPGLLMVDGATLKLLEILKQLAQW